MSVLGVNQSVSGLTWEFKESNERLGLALSQKFGLSEVVAKALSARGINLDTAEGYLRPTLKNHLPNPFSLKDMERAARRMAQSVIAGEPIGLMGDYDVDGATSTALLRMFLIGCGIKPLCFIPDREDGYGPNIGKMKEFAKAGCKLIATLDCGMTAFDPLEYGTRICGLDIIVLDHHDPEKTLPNAYAVVNPKRLDEPLDHPCRYMAAVGVVFLFVVALNNILRSLGFYKDKTEPNLMRYLDLVAFGTVCDVVKLSGVNRLFVKSGLNQMRLGQNKGITALAQLVGLEEAPSAYHLGYVFGPRINACGRVGKSDIGMRLLSTDDEVEAAALAQILEDLNMTRRDIEAAVLHAATEQVEHRMSDDPFIVVQGEDWHQGVVGIVAGRLKDKYNLPVFALSIEGDEVKGSSRSVQGVDLGTLVMNAIEKKILSRGGGHPMAAGFSLHREKLADFYNYLKENITREQIGTDNQILEIDGVVDIGGVTPDLTEQISLLAPFGEANPEPRFVVKNVMISRPILLKNGHIACTLSGRGGKYLSGIAFRSEGSSLGDTLLNTKHKYYHVAGYLKQETWRGKTKMQIQIHDISPV
ncbi:MAG: single-stranded-DNA-specific exonuclease RecJ [Alphaproteobacteria bacterium]|nr:single-stranded-DNA-specific exonuclease RecJ [Alphaproteobacteria bacterium]